MKSQRYRDKVVIVTGASSGIGRALAVRLAAEGAHLALAARDAGRLETIAIECHDCGGTAIPVATDVSDEDQCRQLVDQCLDQYGCINMLINNAGIGQGALLADLPNLDTFKRVVNVNLLGVVHCTYFALPALKASQGRLVNIASLGGRVAIPFNTSYCASKFAVVGFSDSLRSELATDGVSVTVVCPYWVVTEFHERFMDVNGHPAGARGRAIYTPKMMTADRCAHITVDAAWQRRREALMWPGPATVWLQLLTPGLLDRIVMQRFMRPAIRRVRASTSRQ